MSAGMAAALARLRPVVFGREQPRLRATWRFVLAWPLLPLVGALLGVAMPALGVSGMIPGGPIQGIVFLVMLVLWARYIDRRPLSDYGVSASPTWLLNLSTGLIAVIAVWSGWHLVASSLGWMRIEPAVMAPEWSVHLRLFGVLISLAINTWVQDTVFFAIVLASAAEGLRSRDVNATRAVIGGWIVAVVFFTAIHGTPTLLDTIGTAVGGAVFGLLYVHTDDLALTIGVHWGSSYATGAIFASPSVAMQGPSVFEVTKSLPGDISGAAGIGLYGVTYLVLVGWLRLHRGDVSIRTTIAQWNRRPGASTTWAEP